MLVQQILAGKASGDIETVAPETSISDAASIMSKRRIGALVVSNTGRDVLGILSERDIVRELGARGTGCLKDAVSSVMTRKIVTATKVDTAEMVLNTMTMGRFRHMPVMDSEKMIGLISIGDVVGARLREVSTEKEALEGMIAGF
ncbi:MAG: CBS domain-containing protein [Rhodobacteraceae bacterium]|nr:CBS domain-containing protein [Paracoccaceae bacterium]